MASYNIIQNVSLHAIHDMFKKADRDNFSLEALEIIMDNMEENSGGYTNAIDLDIIAICCEWVEQSIEDYINDYHRDEYEQFKENCEEGEEIDVDSVMEELYDNTTAYLLDDGETVLYIAY